MCTWAKSILAALTKEKNLLVIARRLSTIKNAHNIIVLDKSGIKEEGTYKELIAKSGIYKMLWNAHVATKNSGMGQKDGVYNF